MFIVRIYICNWLKNRIEINLNLNMEINLYIIDLQLLLLVGMSFELGKENGVEKGKWELEFDVYKRFIKNLNFIK